MTLAELRQKHSKIAFSGLDYALESGTLSVAFRYRLDPDIEFVTSWKFSGVNADRFAKLDPTTVRAWLVRLGLAEILSYWKTACPAEISVEAGYLSPEELPFWRKLLQNGMGEFFFKNSIDGWQDGFVRWTVAAEQSAHAVDAEPKSARCLTPVGGGKDSAVTVELLKRFGIEQTLFAVNGEAAAMRCMRIAGLPSASAERRLDPKIAELNAAGYLNGHIPFSSVLAFASTFAAFLYGCGNVALSNEWSANEENIMFLGHPANHQYSKSYEFEADFRAYLAANLSTAVEYFSFLRPLRELQIAKIFCRFPEYHPAFVSCNRKIKSGEWCGRCPKCLFACLMLSAFLPQDQVREIFRCDILEDGTLMPTLKELTGLAELKPLECVGTREESKAALHLAISYAGGAPLPKLLAFADEFIVPDKAAAQALADRNLAAYENDSFLPSRFREALKSGLAEHA